MASFPVIPKAVAGRELQNGSVFNLVADLLNAWGGYTGKIYDLAAGAISAASLTLSGAFSAASFLATGSGIGYTTGAGGSVTQLTSKTTGVTINKACGVITTANSAIAAGQTVTFTVTNSLCAARDVPIVSLASGGSANSYVILPIGVRAGAFDIQIDRLGSGSLSEALVINFALIKAVSA